MSDLSKWPSLRAFAILGVLSIQTSEALAEARSCPTGLGLTGTPAAYKVYLLSGGGMISHDNPTRIEIYSVAPGSIAAQAGLTKGHQVISINNHDVGSMETNDLARAIRDATTLAPGKILSLTLSDHGSVSLACETVPR